MNNIVKEKRVYNVKTNTLQIVVVDGDSFKVTRKKTKPLEAQDLLIYDDDVCVALFRKGTWEWFYTCTGYATEAE